MGKTKEKPKQQSSKSVSIECNRIRLIDALASATSFSPERTPKPILKNVCVDVRGKGAVVMASDLEIGCRVALPGVVATSPGRFILPPRRTVDLLYRLRDEVIRVESSVAGGVVISGERGSHTFPYVDPKEFPVVEEFTEEAYHEVPSQLFCRLIGRTVFATDVDAGRYALGGVVLEMEKKRIRGVATDGRRLALLEGPANSVNGHSTAKRENLVIVPSRAMKLIEKLSIGAGSLLIAARNGHIGFKGSDVTIWSRYVEGRFPTWRDVIPKPDGYSVVDFTAGDLLSHVSEASAFVISDYRGVDFTFNSGTLEITYSVVDHGASRVTMPVSYSGNQSIFAIDPIYVIEFLKTLSPSQSVFLKFKDESAPVEFATDDGSKYVVMTMVNRAEQE